MRNMRHRFPVPLFVMNDLGVQGEMWQSTAAFVLYAGYISLADVIEANNLVFITVSNCRPTTFGVNHYEVELCGRTLNSTESVCNKKIRYIDDRSILFQNSVSRLFSIIPNKSA